MSPVNVSFNALRLTFPYWEKTKALMKALMNEEGGLYTGILKETLPSEEDGRWPFGGWWRLGRPRSITLTI